MKHGQPMQLALHVLLLLNIQQVNSLDTAWTDSSVAYSMPLAVYIHTQTNTLLLQVIAKLPKYIMWYVV